MAQLYNHIIPRPALPRNIGQRRINNTEVNINEPYRNLNIQRLSRTNRIQSINYELDRIYPGEEINQVNQGAICINSPNIPKNQNTRRIMLFNVHNFVKQCPNNTIDNRPKNLDYFNNFIQDKQLDYMLLTELTPMVDGQLLQFYNQQQRRNITNEGTFADITERISTIGLNNNFIALTHKESIPPYLASDFYFLSNGIFGNSVLNHKRTYDIGSNRILMSCIVNMFGTDILLFITHVEDQYDEIKYEENIDSIVNIIIDCSNEFNIDNIILGGDFN